MLHPNLNGKKKRSLANMDYFISLVKDDFDKINFTEETFNKDIQRQKILKYFENKIVNQVNNHITNYSFIDLFCGAGGLSAGLENAGLVPELALDKDKSSLLTYHFNRPFLNSSQIINDDIKKVAKEFEFKKTPLVVGGPPCQGFSNANKQRQENDRYESPL